MATITAQNLVDRAGVLIQDATNVRWPQSELLNWLNDGQREIVLLKPEASVKNVAWALQGDSTKQTLPPDGVMLINVHRNMGSAGQTVGTAIRVVDKEVLDSQSPTWHSDTNSVGYVRHFTFDPRDPKTFYVYPKAPTTGTALASPSYSASSSGQVTITSAAHGLSAGNTVYVASAGTVASGNTLPLGGYVVTSVPNANSFTVAAANVAASTGGTITIAKNHAVELVYSASPTDCTLSSTISVDDIYANALLDYVLYRAYSKDADYAQNAQLAVAHYQAFSASLGAKSQNEVARNVNITNGVWSPNVPTPGRAA